MRKRLVRQVWAGVGLGVLICLIICAGVIGTCEYPRLIGPVLADNTVVYTAGKNAFDSAENIWEGVFALIASIIITIMGAALLRVSKLQDKWRKKIRKVLEENDEKPVGGRFKRWSEKYAMFILPFITVLREGIEAVLFIAGVGIGLPGTSIPLAAICGLGAGALIGYLIYKGGNKTSLQIFLVVSTCFLYLVAAGLFSKGVWNLEQDAWVRLAGEGAAEAGAGPGSYDIRKSVWHINVSCVQLGADIERLLKKKNDSSVHPLKTALAVGVSSIRFSAGKTVPRTARSSRIICTGSPSLQVSCTWDGRNARRLSLMRQRI